MNDYIRNRTDEELNSNIERREEDVHKQGAKLSIFGKLIGEDKIENIKAIVYALYDEVCTYDWYTSELSEMYEELERRKNDNAEGD